MLLVLLAVFTSMAEGDPFASFCFVPDGANVAEWLKDTYDAAQHTIAADDGVPMTPAVHGARLGPEINSTRRGTYSRVQATAKQSHADQAQSYHEAISDSALAGVCLHDCKLSCASVLSRNEMFQCFEYSYGTLAWLSDATLKVIAPAAPSPSDTFLSIDRLGMYGRRKRSASRMWRTARTRCGRMVRWADGRQQ